jgi:parallel beta-helix repeat protein
VNIAYTEDAWVYNNHYSDNQNGLYLFYSDRAVIFNATHDDNSYGIYARNSNQVSIKRSSLKNGNSPIYLLFSNEAIIENNRIEGGSRGIASSRSLLAIMDNNTISKCEGSGIYTSYGSNDNSIINNTISGSSIGIQVNNAFRITVWNNTVHGSVNGIQTLYSSDLRILENDIYDCDEDGIQVNGGTNINVKENNLTENSQYGISWITSDVGSIFENYISGSQNGMEYRDSDYGSIYGNSIEYVGHGITTMGSDRNRIDNCTIKDTTGYGIVLSESNQNTVLNNTIMKCRFHGFKLLSSSDNVLYNNALAYNNKALDTFNSSNLQAVDNFPSNRWYNEGRGNYWRDLTEPDDDDDGIVDVPYTFGDGLNYDLYPLTETEFKLVPSIILNLTGYPNGGTSQIGWESPLFDGGEPILGFNLYRKNSTGKYALIQTISPEVLMYFDLSVEAGETYQYQITAYNIVGEGPRSKAVSVLPDITSPVITILTPEEGSYVNSEMVHLTWKGVDPLKNIAKYMVKLDDYSWMDVGLVHELDLPVRGNGSHNITVFAVDVAGNSNATSVEFTVDVELPHIEIMDAEELEWINTSSVYFEWTMSDQYSGIHHIEIRWDDVYWLDKGQNTNIIIKNLGEGPHTAHFKVIDNAGNEFRVSLNFTIDLQDPEIWIEYPETGIMVNTTSLWLKWVGLDHHSGSKTFMVKVDDGDWTDLGIRYNTTVSLDGEGEHVVYLMLIDIAGNQAITELEVIVDRTVPEIISYGPIGSNIDPLSAVIYVELSEILDTNNMEFTVTDLTGTVIWDSANKLFFSYDETMLYGTTYTATIIGKDKAGNHLAPFQWSFSTDDRGYVKGRILDMSNFPIKNAVITIVGSNTTTPDGAGNFILTSSSGQKTIIIEAPGYLPFTREITIVAGETVDLGPIKLEEKIDKGTIKGRTVDENGDPILGVIVTLDTGETYTTDEDGVFEFYVEIGNYTISFERDGYFRHLETAWVKKGQTVELSDIELESTSTGQPESNGDLELWQLQLLIFGVIVILGIIVIFFIMRRSRADAGRIGEE